MKNNKGFTLVELIGVIVVLAIVLGIISVAFINLKKSYDLNYYKSLELTTLNAGSDYFTYNQVDNPKISLKYLIENDYLEEEIKNFDLENSYVSFKLLNNYQKDYKVCLICTDYISEDCN